MKNTGIWLDKDKAIVVALVNGKEQINKIESNIEHFHIHGGSGTKSKGGPQDVVQDSRYLEREKHQTKAYFKTIVSEIKDSNAIAIFGPAQTNEKFNKELVENFNDLSKKVKGLKKVDKMTDNQFVALVKDFFKTNS